MLFYYYCYNWEHLTANSTPKSTHLIAPASGDSQNNGFAFFSPNICYYCCGFFFVLCVSKGQIPYSSRENTWVWSFLPTEKTSHTHPSMTLSYGPTYLRKSLQVILDQLSHPPFYGLLHQFFFSLSSICLIRNPTSHTSLIATYTGRMLFCRLLVLVCAGLRFF